MWVCTLFPICLAAQSPPLESVKSSITVTEKISAEAPASITVLPREEIRGIPGVNLDDRLRNVPGFSLFRRSSGLVAHPTTQGVSLRGIGPSGASRTLVLWDGVPVNDPFGGWVYWPRIAPEELERIEISRGASTSIFGDKAMGGVIQFFSRRPERSRFDAGYEGGNRNSHELSAGLSHVSPRWAASAHGRAFTTGGYFIVPEDRRGSIDRKAGVDFVAANSRLDYFGGPNQFFLKLDLMAEQRANGTALQQNSTSLGTVAGHYFREQTANSFSVLGFHTREQFHSTFSAAAADRNSERLTFRQQVPSEAAGAGAVWDHRRSRLHFLAGGDLSRVEGYSTDSIVPTGKRVGGGTLFQHGTFLQGDLAAGPLQFYAGARHDFTGHHRQFFSPSAGVAAGRGRLRVRASAYRSFRAPTLNELYREFRVGNAVTKANENLRPERLFGVETGLDVSGRSYRAGVTLFRNSLKDLVTNVTLSSTPSLIVRQRQNADEALARGMELHALRRWRDWSGEAAYLFADSRFADGARVPQVPRHQGSASIHFQRGGTFTSMGVRSYASQFEDDQNRYLLPGFAALEFAARQRLTNHLSATVAIENMLDREYAVGFTPTPTIGAPRLWRAGLRWEGGFR